MQSACLSRLFAATSTRIPARLSSSSVRKQRSPSSPLLTRRDSHSGSQTTVSAEKEEKHQPGISSKLQHKKEVRENVKEQKRSVRRASDTLKERQVATEPHLLPDMDVIQPSSLQKILQSRKKVTIIDLRDDESLPVFPGALHIPMTKLPRPSPTEPDTQQPLYTTAPTQREQEFITDLCDLNAKQWGHKYKEPKPTSCALSDKEAEHPLIVLVSSNGIRSESLCHRMHLAGYHNVRSLLGGLKRWQMMTKD